MLSLSLLSGSYNARKQQLESVLLLRLPVLLPQSAVTVYLGLDEGPVSARVKVTPIDTSEISYHVVVRARL